MSETGEMKTEELIAHLNCPSWCYDEGGNQFSYVNPEYAKEAARRLADAEEEVAGLQKMLREPATFHRCGTGFRPYPMILCSSHRGLDPSLDFDAAAELAALTAERDGLRSEVARLRALKITVSTPNDVCDGDVHDTIDAIEKQYGPEALGWIVDLTAEVSDWMQKHHSACSETVELRERVRGMETAIPPGHIRTEYGHVVPISSIDWNPLTKRWYLGIGLYDMPGALPTTAAQAVREAE